MKLNHQFDSAFRRATTFFPAPAVVLEVAGETLKPDGFCAISFDPPIVALTFSRSAPVLTDGEFTVSALAAPAGEGAPASLHCTSLESKEVGDHRMVLAAVHRVEMRGGSPLVNWRRASFPLRLDYPFLATLDVLDAFVRDWRRGDLPKNAWTHAAHVAVTGYYAFDHAPEATFEAMKRGILHFNTSTGGVNGPDSGYHETLTQFWSKTIARSIHDANLDSRLDAATYAVRLFGEDRDLPGLYYSFDVVRDRNARKEWVSPDQEPLPEWYSR